MSQRGDDGEPKDNVLVMKPARRRWEPDAELRAELEADIAAYKRGELETIPWAEFRPVLRSWIAECGAEDDEAQRSRPHLRLVD